MTLPPAILDTVTDTKSLIKYNFFIAVVFWSPIFLLMFYSKDLFKSFLILPQISLIQPLNSSVYCWYVLGIESQYMKYYYYINLLIFVWYNLLLIIYVLLLSKYDFIFIEFIIMNLHFILICRIYKLLYNLKILT